jgi:hypothetical protein
VAVRTTTKAIETIDLFDRVAGQNPLLTEDERSQISEPDPATWRALRLEMTKEKGRSLRIRLARPIEWIEAVRAQEGESFFLDLPEMGAVGNARVVSVGPTPPLTSGKGAVVTGVFAHEANEQTRILRVEFSGEIVIHGVTDNHPFWSEDRKDYVPVGELRQGERVRTRNGTAEVLSMTDRPAKPGEILYNLEVHGENVYHVTSSGVLVHNTCLKPLHPDSSLSPAKLKDYGNLSTLDLIDSLKPGQPGSLKTRPDGTMLDGHHRIKILRDRGIDVDSLPREIIPN